MSQFRRNHYVPEWFQHRFLPSDAKQRKFYYLDLDPDTVVANGRRYKRRELLRWGPPRCFCERDLYTTRLGSWESTEIEERFFGKIDSSGRNAVEYFATFEHPSADEEAFQKLLIYMSIQKLRTPKGLNYLADLVQLVDENQVLFKMQELQQLFCALWTECVWAIVDASESDTKFILSDHPVTVYNRACFPGSKWCRGDNDPGIWLSGTHTLFPLSLDKMLILSNLSWARNPYGNPLKKRPNPNLFRAAMFNFMQIQTGRSLSDTEVNYVNLIVKKRARRYIAAARKEWLYPEKRVPTQRWDKLDDQYRLMPDPRSMIFSTEVLIGYSDKRADGFDEYGNKPWQPGYNDKQRQEEELRTFDAFQGEFARIHGPKRRGRSYELGVLGNEEDDPDYHAYHLSLEGKYKPKHAKRRRRKSR